MPVVILNLGMGVDSAAILTRWLREPATRPCPLEELVVVTSQVGNEFPDTIRLMERHLVPAMNAAGVRWVQVGKTGPSVHDWKVIEDSRCTSRVHLEGAGYTLAEENHQNGVTPQTGGCRKCSIKFKGEVIDRWIVETFPGMQFVQVMGFNDEEHGRAERDAKGGDNNPHVRDFRTPSYPLIDWKWDRATCERYLEETYGEPWAKSCCYFCPYAGQGVERESLARRWVEFPELAADALVQEYRTMAFNHRQPLFKSVSALATVTGHGNADALKRYEAKLAEGEWAVYRLRRVYRRAENKAGGVTTMNGRALEKVEAGSFGDMKALLEKMAEAEGAKSETIEHGICRAVHAVKDDRDDGWVGYRIDHWLVLAPAGTNDKVAPFFKKHWEAARAS